MRLSALPKIVGFGMSPDFDFRIGESLLHPNEVSREPTVKKSCYLIYFTPHSCIFFHVLSVCNIL